MMVQLRCIVVIYLLPPFFFAATTRKLPLLSSRLGSLTGPFFATSLHPPVELLAALLGLALLGGADVSTSPLSASLLRRRYSSAK